MYQFAMHTFVLVDESSLTLLTETYLLFRELAEASTAPRGRADFTILSRAPTC